MQYKIGTLFSAYDTACCIYIKNKEKEIIFLVLLHIRTSNGIIVDIYVKQMPNFINSRNKSKNVSSVVFLTKTS